MQHRDPITDKWGSNLFMDGCKKAKLTMGQYSALCQIEIALYRKILWLYSGTSLCSNREINMNKILTFQNIITMLYPTKRLSLQVEVMKAVWCHIFVCFPMEKFDLFATLEKKIGNILMSKKDSKDCRM